MASAERTDYRIYVTLGLVQFILGVVILLFGLFTPAFVTVLGVHVLVVMGVGLLVGGVAVVLAARSNT